jgi:hypothetical protein
MSFAVIFDERKGERGVPEEHWIIQPPTDPITKPEGDPSSPSPLPVAVPVFPSVKVEE